MPRKTMNGLVVSDKMQKTVVVQVTTSKRHRLYNKVLRHSTKYLAHDEQEDCNVGDWVLIEESRPLSHRKRWKVVEVLRRAGQG